MMIPGLLSAAEKIKVRLFASYSISGFELPIGNFGRLNSSECLYIHIWTKGTKGECWIDQHFNFPRMICK